MYSRESFQHFVIGSGRGSREYFL